MERRLLLALPETFAFVNLGIDFLNHAVLGVCGSFQGKTKLEHGSWTTDLSNKCSHFFHFQSTFLQQINIEVSQDRTLTQNTGIQEMGFENFRIQKILVDLPTDISQSHRNNPMTTLFSKLSMVELLNRREEYDALLDLELLQLFTE